MAGSVTGGKKAARTNRRLHGRDFYKRIGAIGGKLGHTGGFATFTACQCPEFSKVHHKAMCAGARGGRISKRRSSTPR